LSLGLETSEIFNGHETISRAHVLAWAPLFVSKGSPRASKPVSGVPRLFFDTTFLPLHFKDSKTFYEPFNCPCLLHKVEHNVEDYFLLFQKGEERGFSYFFHLHYQPLVFFAKRILKDDTLAEDIVENSFLKLFEKRDSIKSSSTVKGFLFTLVRNGCLDTIRQQKLREAHNKSFAYLQTSFEEICLKEIVCTESLSLIIAAIEELPPASQKVFKMFYLEGKGYDQIALELGRSRQTIKTQKKLALSSVRKKLLLFLPFIFSFITPHLF
jgi:RNA polymerase sigma-70 factor (family 1)